MKYDIISIFLIRSMIFDLHCRSGQPLSTIVQSGLTLLSLAPESPGAHPDSFYTMHKIWEDYLVVFFEVLYIWKTLNFPCP